jgi:hypothetical protein
VFGEFFLFIIMISGVLFPAALPLFHSFVKWYSTLVLTIWFVSACEYAGNGSRYKASR